MEKPPEVNDREQRVLKTVQTWRELLATSSLDESTKEKILVFINESENLLGKPGTGIQWDTLDQKLNTIATVARIQNSPAARDVADLIGELNLDMARKHKEFLIQ